MSEKLVYVRVAKALGWTWKRSPGGNCRFLCPPTADNPHNIDPSGYVTARQDELLCADALRYVPRYDTDWSATGPILERYRMTVEWDGGDHRAPWKATPIALEFDLSEGIGPTPLVAVCNLILALSEAGKLEPTKETTR